MESYSIIFSIIRSLFPLFQALINDPPCSRAPLSSPWPSKLLPVAAIKKVWWKSESAKQIKSMLKEEDSPVPNGHLVVEESL